MRKIRKHLRIKALIAALLLSTCFASAPLMAKAKSDGIVAIVNDSIILNSDVEALTQRIVQYADPNDLPNSQLLREQVIDQLINDTLLMQQAEKSNLKVSNEELENAIRGIAEQNGLTLTQLKQYLKSVGIDYTMYSEQIRKDMIMDQIRLAELRDRITVSDFEIDRIAKTIKEEPSENLAVHLSHILIALPENPTQDEIQIAKQKVNLIKKSLASGESFAKLARSYSNDNLALQGGDMGWSEINALPTLFEEYAFKAKKGEIIGPITSGVGFHILKVNDVRKKERPKVTVNEVHAKHILLTTNVILTDDDAKTKLERIRNEILSGELTFENAARVYSEDPGTVNKGGDLGWTNADVYDPGFKKGLLALKEGEISQPIKSQFGWHLILLEGKRTTDATVLAQKDQAYRTIFNRKFAEESQVWTQALRGDAYIKIIDEDDE